MHLGLRGVVKPIRAMSSQPFLEHADKRRTGIALSQIKGEDAALRLSTNPDVSW